jgi:hypothetical protein
MNAAEIKLVRELHDAIRAGRIRRVSAAGGEELSPPPLGDGYEPGTAAGGDDAQSRARLSPLSRRPRQGELFEGARREPLYRRQ